ncbi:MAG: hypothetical protein AAFO94_16825, partial [Bacteroidota bacterium]
MPLDRIISARAENEPLELALNDLFSDTDIIYKSIGDQLVLRVDARKNNYRTISYSPAPPERREPQKETTLSSREQERMAIEEEKPTPPVGTEEEEFIYQPPAKTAEDADRKRNYHGMARAKVPQAIRPVEMMPITIGEFAESQQRGQTRKLDFDFSKYEAFILRIENDLKKELDKTEEELENAVDNILTNWQERKARRRERKASRKAKKAMKTDIPVVEEQPDSQATSSLQIFDNDELATVTAADSASIAKADMELAAAEEITLQRRPAQLSFLPYVGTNFGKSRQIKNHFSVNVLWGVNGGVEGVEMAGLLNSLRKDMNGVQMAGVGNIVRGNSYGVQAAGLVNYNAQRAHGVQMSGLVNVSGRGGTVAQFAGLGNVTGGNAGIQLSGLFNVAGQRVETIQAAPIFNRARNVRGIQLGLINVVDTIGFAPIGLINIVRSGRNKYNKVELGTGTVFDGIGELKFGAKRLYN